MVFTASLFTTLWEVDGCVCLQCLISIDLGGDGVVLVLITTQGRTKWPIHYITKLYLCMFGTASIQSTKYRSHSTEYIVQSTKYRSHSTEYIVQSTKYTAGGADRGEEWAALCESCCEACLWGSYCEDSFCEDSCLWGFLSVRIPVCEKSCLWGWEPTTATATVRQAQTQRSEDGTKVTFSQFSLTGHLV